MMNERLVMSRTSRFNVTAGVIFIQHMGTLHRFGLKRGIQQPDFTLKYSLTIGVHIKGSRMF